MLELADAADDDAKAVGVYLKRGGTRGASVEEMAAIAQLPQKTGAAILDQLVQSGCAIVSGSERYVHLEAIELANRDMLEELTKYYSEIQIYCGYDAKIRDPAAGPF